MDHKNIYNIPAGVPFLPTLARYCLDRYEDPAVLADVQIILPTRRACRVLKDYLVEHHECGALMLPRLCAIGDVDETYILQAFFLDNIGQNYDVGVHEIMTLLPAISRLKRQILLGRLIYEHQKSIMNFDYALRLADALGRLMDQVYTAGISWEGLIGLVPDEFAEHWQITLDFLHIIVQEWPKILKAHGVVDYADRRRRLIKALDEHWQKYPPRTPVIAAGSTGSIPAVSDLLLTIARCEHGVVILPGLDPQMDDAYWAEISETHPQFGLKHFLDRTSLARTDVRVLPGGGVCDSVQGRHDLCSALMRPSAFTESGFSDPSMSFDQSAFNGVSLYECETLQEEARLIALLMREALEKPDETLVVITQNRTLSAYIRHMCHRWGIVVDDSAGIPLSETAPGRFLDLILNLCISGVRPVPFLALLKTGFCGGVSPDVLQNLDVDLRGPKPDAGFVGLMQAVQDPACRALIADVAALCAPLMNLSTGRHGFKVLFQAHMAVAQALNVQATHTIENDDAGPDIQDFCVSLMQGGDADDGVMPPLSLEEYRDVLQVFMQGVTVRSPHSGHARVQILGQLEARMVHADVLVMAGLNEGSWPSDAGHDPWMSRPMRERFGLPSPERGIGLAAHDFVQGFCSPKVVMTRSLRHDGTPDVPSRWLRRLWAIMDIQGVPRSALKTGPHLHWVRALETPVSVQSCVRPAPVPPVSSRPRRLPATKVELWLRDPYAIYGRYILDLKPLMLLEQSADYALKGTILHESLDGFVTAHPDNIPPEGGDILMSLMQKTAQAYHIDPALWMFWAGRFQDITRQFIDHERDWRERYRTCKTEVTGHLQVGAMTITARADRLDVGPEGVVVIDYKSAGMFSVKSVESGWMPQLTIAGLIAESGGFEGVALYPVSSVQYWRLGRELKITEVTRTIDTVLSATRQGLGVLVESFMQSETPYYSLPDISKRPAYNDFEHLARVREWSVTGDDGEDAA